MEKHVLTGDAESRSPHRKGLHAVALALEVAENAADHASHESDLDGVGEIGSRRNVSGHLLDLALQCRHGLFPFLVPNSEIPK
jgi:hypothetical protein